MESILGDLAFDVLFVPSMSKNVQMWMRQCKRCILVKDVFLKIKALMVCNNVKAPLKILAMDFTLLEQSPGGRSGPD